MTTSRFFYAQWLFKAVKGLGDSLQIQAMGGWGEEF